ncbi:phosphotransferase family protein [Streptomyces niveus]|uniref:phosphotransferase family protein n=1 Tax=Streptomyces niveus TaxID=193462 RepID=UPI00386BA965
MGKGDRFGLDGPTWQWLAEEALPGVGITGVSALKGGSTNEMLLLTTVTGRNEPYERCERYVLRRHRPSETRTRRNTCAVEAALLRRVAATVPVADLVATDPYGHATGVPLLLYRHVEGVPLDALLARRPGAADAAELGAAVGQTLARISLVEVAGPGHFHDETLTPAGRASDTELLPFVERCLDSARPGSPLTAADADALRGLAARTAHQAAAVRGHDRLVHHDFNPKNVLVSQENGRWRVGAVLDWEQAFSGSPLYDVGNMLRIAHLYPPQFAEGFVAGCRNGDGNGDADGDGLLPPGWRALSRALDLFTLADILTAPPDEAYFLRARDALHRHLAEEFGPAIDK